MIFRNDYSTALAIGTSLSWLKQTKLILCCNQIFHRLKDVYSFSLSKTRALQATAWAGPALGFAWTGHGLVHLHLLESEV